MRRPTWIPAAWRLAAAALAAALLAGCASFAERISDAQLPAYFRDAGPPPAQPLQHTLATLPFREYWTGIVFNGDKIGYAHFALGPAADEPGRYEVRSEASFVLRFLGVEKKVQLKARDTIDADLALAHFAYDYRIDGSRLEITGRAAQGELVTSVVAGGQPVEQRFPAPGPLVPISVTALYPVIQGLALGREFRYPVYSGETQSLAEVRQRVLAYESSDLLEGRAFRVETTLQGQRALTWIDALGRPALEIGMQGVMISALEDEATARRYVALAALNKRETLVEFSIVRPATPIAEPRAVTALKIALEPAGAPPPDGATQRCASEATELVCEVRRSGFADASPTPGPEPRHLAPSLTIQSNDPRLRELARAIAPASVAAAARVAQIVRWMDAHIEKAPLDVFSALDVLDSRKAECQGHAYLYAALARAADLPTRMVNGLAYSAELNGFLFHSWAESFVDGRWQAVDPTFGQVVADATHVRLFEGETLAELLPILDLVGKLRVRVLEVEHAGGERPR